MFENEFQEMLIFEIESEERIKKPSVKECLHLNCSKCSGTGMKKDGTLCIHMMSCPCSACSPFRL